MSGTSEGVANMVYQLPPISTAMSFAYANPPPSGTPSPASSHHSAEHAPIATLAPPHITPTTVTPEYLQPLPTPVTTAAPLVPPPASALTYNLLPTIDILRSSAPGARNQNHLLWGLDPHQC